MERVEGLEIDVRWLGVRVFEGNEDGEGGH